jgi:hypothetical protein
MISPCVLSILCSLGLAACAGAVPITEQQVLGSLDNQEDWIGSSNPLSGRFLHLTGIVITNAGFEIFSRKSNRLKIFI